jgi:hypothetical protein
VIIGRPQIRLVLSTFDHEVTSGTLSLVPTDSELRLPTELSWSGDTAETQITKVNNQLISLPKLPPQSRCETILYLPENAKGWTEFNAQIQLRTSDQQDHHISQLVGIEILSPWKYHTKSCYLTSNQTLEQFTISLSEGQAPLKLSESWFEFSDGLKSYFCTHDMVTYHHNNILLLAHKANSRVLSYCPKDDYGECAASCVKN